MKTWACLPFLLLGFAAAHAAPEMLIVADEFPAMETLATAIRQQAATEIQIVPQDKIPTDLTGFRAVIVYIHGKLEPEPERRFIEYARAGGKLILLHHSISSGKRKNKQWFSFLGISLPEGEYEKGGYKWIEPATLEVVNIAPDHFVTAHDIEWPERVAYRAQKDPEERSLPAFALPESEVYLNHVLNGERTVLLGFRYADPESKQVIMQNTAGWYRAVGKGWVFYFKPGHSVRDFEHPVYRQILLNALAWQP